MSYNLLLSYHYHKSQNLAERLNQLSLRPNLFIDSGAFSAMSVGAEIQLDEYAAYLDTNKKLISVAANLDVIGDPDATWENQIALESEGLKPLPVFHTNEPFSYLERYVERYDYIALGGCVGKTAKHLRPWLQHCFDIAGDNARFHGFGITNRELVFEFPWKSVDSSGWGAGHRYGVLMLIDPMTGKTHTLKRQDWRKWQMLPLWRYYPVNKAALKRWDLLEVAGCAALSRVYMQHRAARTNKDFKLFLADSNWEAHKAATTIIGKFKEFQA